MPIAYGSARRTIKSGEVPGEAPNHIGDAAKGNRGVASDSKPTGPKTTRIQRWVTLLTKPRSWPNVNLRLNGWPPLASHMSCVLLGVSLAHLSWREPEAGLQLPANAVIFSLPAAWERTLLDLPAPGSSVHLVLRRSSGARCRLSASPLQLLRNFPRPTLSADYAVSTAVLLLFKDLELKGTNAALEPAQLSRTLALCSAKPKVSYGPA